MLRAALCSAASWSALWQLTLNIIKSIVQHLGRSNPKYNYHLSGLTLESCDQVKDLGITVNKDLSYHKHIENITSAAAKRFYIAKSCFRSTSIPVLRIMLKAFIIPSLECGSVIWNPHSRHEKDSLEEVQRRITALALGKDMSYARRLKMFDFVFGGSAQYYRLSDTSQNLIQQNLYQPGVLVQYEHTVISAN